MGFVYRARQFIHNLSAQPRTDDLRAAQTLLAPHLYQLFQQMDPADQVHSLMVFKSLKLDGEEHPDLLAAALLHDVGKTHVRPALWQRVLAVLGEPFLKNRAASMAELPARGWRKGFVIAAAHPQWGADMVSQAGGSKRLVRLIRFHQLQDLNGLPSDEVYLIRRLQTVDSRH